ncbi:MAG: hypothetical protein ACXABY_18170, partial [Candidatus Thorarchaeota archaeon]
MLRTVAANTDGTMFEDLMSNETFRAEYAAEFGQEALESFSMRNRDDIRRREGLKYKLGFEDELKPHAGELVASLKHADLGFVVYAGAPIGLSWMKYAAKGILIDAVYSVRDYDRKEPLTFYAMRNRMDTDGYDPLAYLSHVPGHVSAAAKSWGKALLSNPGLENPDKAI